MTEDPFERAVSRTRDRRRRRAARAARAGLRIHAAVYVAVNGLLAVVWWSTPSDAGIPWIVYPVVFWGIGLAAHFFGVRGAGTVRRSTSEIRPEGSGSEPRPADRPPRTPPG